MILKKLLGQKSIKNMKLLLKKHLQVLYRKKVLKINYYLNLAVIQKHCCHMMK